MLELYKSQVAKYNYVLGISVLIFKNSIRNVMLYIFINKFAFKVNLNKDPSLNSKDKPYGIGT